MNPLELEQRADRLLLTLRKKPGVYFKISVLERALKLDKLGVVEALAEIKKWGYKIRTRPDAVAFIKAPDSLTPTEIGYRLKTGTIGRTIVSYRSVKSTNDLAAELAQSSAGEGTVVTAEEQTKGRGRLGRKWHSPPGTGIYASIVLKPGFKPENAPGLSVMTAVALADAVKKFCGGDVRIKWPNDVLINGKKTAGILTELTADKDKIDYVIIGVGINVNQGTGNFHEELKNIATSLRRVNRRKVNRVKLFKTFLVNFENEYKNYTRHQLKKAHGRIRKYSSLIGHEIKIQLGRRLIEGKVVDIDATGRLILECEGKKVPVIAGEVTVVKE
ncbi:MAG: biotin--[acetyl-CoA-carboxylase] ligase [candidate division Zixibacteria bacterium]|nr:biotin--[acetyl-CoA-carboxylase] ligase [candidate division Zixibacteria bacterium]